MPRSPTSKASHRPNPVHDSDAVLRKKKNADAQAAFRQRRANYITTLEETVTGLENAVLQLQDSCRELRTEAQESKRDCDRLRHELREREKFWRNLWQSSRRPTTETPDVSTLTSPYPGTPTDVVSSYAYPPSDPYATTEPQLADPASYAGRVSHAYQQPPTPTTSYTTVPDTRRTQKYGSYPYPMPEGDNAWAATAGSSSSAHATPAVTPSTAQPTAGPSSFSEPAAPMTNFTYTDHRSSSPVTPSSTTTPMYTFHPETVAGDRTEYDYRRQSSVSCPDVALHGGSDMALAASGSDAVRYRMAMQSFPTNGERPMLPGFSSLTDATVHYGHAYDDEARRRSFPSAVPPVPATQPPSSSSAHTSRSPSPGSPALSSTLSVLKAQSFGGIRRTRARARKTSDGGAKSIDATEPRAGDGSDSAENL